MNKKEFFFILLISLIIFTVGFFLRIESAEMHGLNETDKQFFTDDNGLPYFYEFDGYFYYRLSENYLEHGHFGDRINNNQSWDSYFNYPHGSPTNVYSPLILWIAIAFYYMINFFTNISLLEACFWLPAVLAPFSGIIGYLFVRKYVGELGAFVTGILLVTAPIYFVRTVPGFFDTDMLNILFPLLALWFFSEAHESSNNNYMVLNIFLASLSLSLFALAWNGWSYIFFIFILSGLIYLIICKIKGIKIKNFLIIYSLFLGFSFILILLITDTRGIISLISRPLSFITRWQGLTTSYWPNMINSISELKKPSMNEFITWLGPINFGLGFFGSIMITSVMLRNNMKKRYLPKLSFFLFILICLWLIIATFSYASSLRFGIILVPPLTIFSGLMVGVAIKYFDRSRFKVLNSRIIKILSLFFIVLITIQPILDVINIYPSLVPRADDDMVDGSLWIKSNTPENTVVFSDWSYGYFLTDFAKRPVIVDGGSQFSSRSYWLYRSFTTDNETLAIGIMRMLSSGGDISYLTLENYTHNTSLTVEIMNSILGVSKDEARHILVHNYKINPKLAEKILKGSHPSKNPNFVVFTNDLMIYSAYRIFLYGNWDFNTRSNNYLYSTGFTRDLGDIKKYNNSVILNIKNKTAFWNGKTPYCISIPQKNDYKTYYLNNNSNFCIIFSSDYKKVLVLDKKLEKSVFIKLVVFKQPTKYFKPVYKNKSVTVWEPVM